MTIYTNILGLGCQVDPVDQIPPEIPGFLVLCVGQVVQPYSR